ncbi:surfactant protein Bb [Engraulis encrasicolus]|uniref:surfactant protein Bb n=1 Tax=Engraulis encrasicolus TaxID=184585 RepID=UPI002FD336E7
MTTAVFTSLLIFTALSMGQTRVVIDSSMLTTDADGLTEGLTSKRMCEDCTKITQVLMGSTMLTPMQFAMLKKTLYGVCQKLPKGDLKNRCFTLVDHRLPAFMQSDLCSLLGVCPAKPTPTPEADQLPNVHLNGNDMLDLSPAFLPTEGTKPVVPAGSTCTLCITMFKKLEEMLPKDRTEDQVVQMLSKVCKMMPEKHIKQCNELLAKYGKQVVDFVLSDMAPHTICVMLRLCMYTPPKELPVASDCTSCLTLSALTRFHLGRNATEMQIASLMQNVCQRHPDTIPQCEIFTQIYESKLPRILGKQHGGQDACEKEDFCQGQSWENIH